MTMDTGSNRTSYSSTIDAIDLTNVTSTDSLDLTPRTSSSETIVNKKMEKKQPGATVKKVGAATKKRAPGEKTPAKTVTSRPKVVKDKTTTRSESATASKSGGSVFDRLQAKPKVKEMTAETVESGTSRVRRSASTVTRPGVKTATPPVTKTATPPVTKVTQKTLKRSEIGSQESISSRRSVTSASSRVISRPKVKQADAVQVTDDKKTSFMKKMLTNTKSAEGRKSVDIKTTKTKL